MKIFKHHIMWVVMIICISLLPIGCGAGQVVRRNPVVLEIQKPVIIKKTGHDNRPVWTSERPYFEDNAAYYFTGGCMGGADYTLTLRLAKSEAIKNLLESIEIRAQAEFGSAIQGQNRDPDDLGRYVTDAVAWTIDSLRIKGIRHRKNYYEQVFDPMNRRLRYNAWVQIGISKQDYLKAKSDSAKRLLDEVIRDQDKQAEQRVRELLEKIRHET